MIQGSHPHVSVITIFLNAERFLQEAIDSVLSQGFDDFELILVDDGSTDQSTAIAHSYVDRTGGRARYVEHEGHANKGMSASRNLGLRCARGQLVAFIDADDVWAPQKLAEQVAILDANPNLAMVCGAVCYWRSWAGGRDDIIFTGHLVNQVIFPPEASLALYPLGTAAAPCPSDFLLRRSAMERVGGFEEHFTGPRQMYEDQGFLAKIYFTMPVYFSDRVWLYYRQHDDSCVAVVTRESRYHEVRRYFLVWLERYLESAPPEIRRAVSPALRRALRPYRRPLLYAVSISVCRLSRVPRRIAAAWDHFFDAETTPW